MPAITRSQTKCSQTKSPAIGQTKTESKSAHKCHDTWPIMYGHDLALELIEQLYSKFTLQLIQDTKGLYKLIYKHLDNRINSIPSDESKIISLCKSAKLDGVCIVNKMLITRLKCDFCDNKQMMTHENKLISSVIDILEFIENYQLLLSKKKYNKLASDAFLKRLQFMEACSYDSYTFHNTLHIEFVWFIQNQISNAICAYNYANEI